MLYGWDRWRKKWKDPSSRSKNFSSVSIASYAAVLQNTYGATEIWPLVNISSGTAISAFVNSNRNGTLTGWDLQNAAGPVTGTLAPYSDGVNDYGDLYTSNGTDGFVDTWNGAEVAFFGWIKPNGTGWWTNGNNEVIFDVAPDVDNQMVLQKIGGTGDIRIRYEAGATVRQISVDPGIHGSVTWFSVAFTASASDDELKCFINGSQVGSTATTLGTWGTDPDSVFIGATNAVPQSVVDGHMAYFAIKFDSVWTPTQILAMHNAAATAGAD